MRVAHAGGTRGRFNKPRQSCQPKIMPQVTGLGRKPPRPSKSGLEGETLAQPKGGHPSLDLQARHINSGGGSARPPVKGIIPWKLGGEGIRSSGAELLQGSGGGGGKKSFLTLPHGKPLVLAHVWEVS